MRREVLSNRPFHYCVLPLPVDTIASQLKGNLLKRFGKGGDSATSSNKELFYSAMEVKSGSGYYKAHISDVVSLSLLEYKAKRNAEEHHVLQWPKRSMQLSLRSG